MGTPEKMSLREEEVHMHILHTVNLNIYHLVIGHLHSAGSHKHTSFLNISSVATPMNSPRPSLPESNPRQPQLQVLSQHKPLRACEHEGQQAAPVGCVSILE